MLELFSRKIRRLRRQFQEPVIRSPQSVKRLDLIYVKSPWKIDVILIQLQITVCKIPHFEFTKLFWTKKCRGNENTTKIADGKSDSIITKPPTKFIALVRIYLVRF